MPQRDSRSRFIRPETYRVLCSYPPDPEPGIGMGIGGIASGMQQTIRDVWNSPLLDEYVATSPPGKFVLPQRLPNPTMKVTWKPAPTRDSTIFQAEFMSFTPVRDGDEVVVVAYEVSGHILESMTDPKEVWDFVMLYFQREFEHWQDEKEINWVDVGGAKVYVPLAKRACQTIT